jgi:ParB family chromosome partitioning protein
VIKEIEISDIIKGENIRKDYDYDSITELTKSILSVGLINPITVIEEKGKYKVIAGFRRFMACQFAKLQTIPCNVVDNINTVQLQIIENIQREDISDIDLERAIKNLIDSGMIQEDVAKMIGKTQSWISKVIKVENMRRRINQKEDTKELPTNALIELTSIPEEKQAKAVKELKTKKTTVKNAREINKKYSPAGNKGKQNERQKLWVKVQSLINKWNLTHTKKLCIPERAVTQIREELAMLFQDTK